MIPLAEQYPAKKSKAEILLELMEIIKKVNPDGVKIFAERHLKEKGGFTPNDTETGDGDMPKDPVEALCTAIRNRDLENIMRLFRTLR